jgi:hypothetical protein
VVDDEISVQEVTKATLETHGYQINESVAKIMNEGVKTFMAKPFTAQELTTISNLLAKFITLPYHRWFLTILSV